MAIGIWHLWLFVTSLLPYLPVLAVVVAVGAVVAWLASAQTKAPPPP